MSEFEGIPERLEVEARELYDAYQGLADLSWQRARMDISEAERLFEDNLPPGEEPRMQLVAIGLKYLNTLSPEGIDRTIQELFEECADEQQRAYLQELCIRCGIIHLLRQSSRRTVRMGSSPN